MILLGNWHSYKELCMLVYQKHLRTLFGPILGQFSQSTLLLKPKLGILETYFNWFMLVFRYEKEYLYSAISKTEKSEILIILNNIKFAFESSIPFVS